MKFCAVLKIISLSIMVGRNRARWYTRFPPLNVVVHTSETERMAVDFETIVFTVTLLLIKALSCSLRLFSTALCYPVGSKSYHARCVCRYTKSPGKIQENCFRDFGFDGMYEFAFQHLYKSYL